MRLISYNIEYCMGINRRWKYLDPVAYFKIVSKTRNKICDFLKRYKPDIIGLIEIDSGSVRNKRKSEVLSFSENLNMNYWVEKTKHARRRAYRVLNFVPIYRKYANAVISKVPLEGVVYYYLSRGVKRLVIVSKIQMKQGKKNVEVNLFTVHLALRRKTRRVQLEELSRLVNLFKGPKIVFGDFNIFKGRSEIEFLLENSELEDASIHSKSNTNYTFPSWNPKSKVDLVLVSKEIKIKRYEVLQAEYSDHLPVLVDFEL